jgi:hypothetical protein
VGKLIRCFGQDFDSGYQCPEFETCARFVDLSKEQVADEVRIASIHRKAGEEKCAKRIEKSSSDQST